MELHLKLSGVLMIVLALAHLFFPRYFAWKKEFAGLSLINREMMYVHTFFIAVVVFMLGVLCYASAGELLYSALGKKISLGICVFWTLRLVIQFFGYSAALWKGKRFETTIHILFSLLWLYFTLVFFFAFLHR